MILINGYGKMGKTLFTLRPDSLVVDPHCPADGRTFFHNLAQVDVLPEAVVDFSTPTALRDLVPYVAAHAIPLVVATTGFSDADRAILQDLASHIPLFVADNMSLCVYTFVRSAANIARTMSNPLLSVHGVHRLGKRDAPSGTAKVIANALCTACRKRGVVLGDNSDADFVSVTSERIGDTVGVHRIIMQDVYQRLDLCHAAFDRSLFALGALGAASYLQGKPNGLYGMAHLYHASMGEAL